LILSPVSLSVSASLFLPAITDNCGTTAVVALLAGTRLYVANAGDSRCVLSRGGSAIDLSNDHKATLASEETVRRDTETQRRDTEKRHREETQRRET
jgi:serine/threonine protein phosphatase PrpC